MTSASQAAVPKMLPRENARYAAARDRCVAKLRAVSPFDGDRAPLIGNPDLTWIYCPEHNWVATFRTGALWLSYKITSDRFFVDRARARTDYLEKLTVTPEWHDHDLGFLYSLSEVADFKMTGSRRARENALGGTQRLADRFVGNGGYILAWDGDIGFNKKETGAAWKEFVKGRMIADTSQNLALLYWAAEEGGDHRFADIASRHAQVAAEHLVRADYTTFHTFAFDPDTGMPEGGATYQGYADESCWARGQAWLIHGFAQTYINSGEVYYLELARNLAAKFEELLDEDTLPPWDFSAPESSRGIIDSSAASVAASGFLLIAELTEGPKRDHSRDAGLKLLDGLLDRCDLTDRSEAHGFLDEGAANVPKGRDRAMLPYGDYYFMEALMRATGHKRFFW